MAERLASSLFDLTSKVAVVTGGSRGIGRSLCRGFAAHGADVVVASRNQQACDEVADGIRQDTGRDAIGVATHVGRWADCDALVESVYAHFGRADILVNNAGMSPLYPSLVEVSEELWDKVLNVNLRGPFRLAALFGTRMAAAEGGSIINVSSLGAVRPGPDELPYCAAKAGVNAMTVGLARSFGPKVRVNAIMPGWFLTDISKAWDAQRFANVVETIIPLRRGGEPDEMIGTALYLASDASSYTTGAVLKVDGGAGYATD